MEELDQVAHVEAALGGVLHEVVHVRMARGAPRNDARAALFRRPTVRVAMPPAAVWFASLTVPQQ